LYNLTNEQVKDYRIYAKREKNLKKILTVHFLDVILLTVDKKY